MPFLTEEEVDDINKQIDTLEESRSNLDELNDNYKEEIQEKANKLKGLTTACILLFLAFIGTVLFGFVLTNKQTSATTTTAESEPTIIRDTVYIEKNSFIQNTSNSSSNDLSTYYGIQIGVYKKYDVEFTSEVQKIYDGDLIYYVLGKFATHQQANYFRLILLDFKIQDAVVVKVENGRIAN